MNLFMVQGSVPFGVIMIVCATLLILVPNIALLLPQLSASQ